MKKGFLAVVSLVAVGLFVYACGGGGGGGGGVAVAGSCDAPTSTQTCLEVVSPASPAVLAAAQADCDSADGEVWSTRGCAVQGSLGICTANAENVLDDSGTDGGTLTGQVRIHAYPSFPAGAIGAKGMCEGVAQGTWAGAAGSSPDAGFGGSITAAFTGSCNDVDSEFCTDHHLGVVTGGDLTALETECEGDGSVWSSTACPTTNRVGTCSLAVGQGAGTKIRFYPPTTAAIGQLGCTAMTGTWTAN